MSQTTPNPIAGSNNPFRSDDEARDESRQGDDETDVLGLPFLDPEPDPDDDGVDVDEPGDRI
ncbi:hypothetical protein ACPPVS_08840 [Cellulomonas sp. McL0617]|uniref:hypothetical protein n=1 Tax=Cellulomonas sp. McL0617 TaxID=3415675 RepID=UPI003CF9FC5C